MEKWRKKKGGYSLSIKDHNRYNNNKISGINPDQENGLNSGNDWN